MNDEIYTHIDPLFKKYEKLNKIGLSKTSTEVITGDKLNRPGDDPVPYSVAALLDLSASAERVYADNLQNNVSWYQTSLDFLGRIRSLLSDMSALAQRTSTSAIPQADREILNEQFQSLKREISYMVDGLGGKSTAASNFNTVPLFLGQTPLLQSDLNANIDKEAFESVNLYTGMNQQGFSEMPLLTVANSQQSPTLTGTADAGTATTLTLDVNASGIDGAYIDAALEITAGTGVGQTARIIDYDAFTRIATLDTTLAVPPDATSDYTITSPQPNTTLWGNTLTASVRFAENIWGADNNRVDRLTEASAIFRSLTPEEQAYRIANVIPDTDLEPKTYAEKIARRELNIFDSEFGNLLVFENSKRMFSQINNAIEQVSQVATRQQSRLAHIQKQRLFNEALSQQHIDGIDSIKNMDPAKVISVYQNLSVNAEYLTNLMSFPTFQTQAYDLVNADPAKQR